MSNTITVATSLLGMTTPEYVDEKFRSVRNLSFTVDAQIQKLEEEGCLGVENQREITLINNVTEELRKFSKLIDEIGVALDRLKNDKNYRQWKAQLSNRTDEYRSFQETVKRHNDALQRASLLKMEENRRPLYNGRDSHEVADSYYRTNKLLDNSLQAADDSLRMGWAASGALDDQNDLIKRLHEKMLDIGNTLGLSNSVMKMIDRRQFVDKLITYSGMVIILTIIFVLWYFYK
eukprot:TRINITY_DN5030_c0_g1_i1.p1 TRINITY_DN5030_c0_g1~~TRINITY_DN5030_c0_g1_i1.p1  ORF type:complete len:234 (-),score=25.16 TRINITY_DN5030_c0_g1_i1:44-745(-)